MTAALRPWPAPPALEAWRAALPSRHWTDGAGHAWHYRDSGRAGGPALVLLPGALGNGDTAWRIAEAFAATHRVLSVTYPGGATAPALADGLAALLTACGVERPAVWGSSYGAWWAQAFALRHTGRVAALWLGNTMVDGGDVAHLPFFERDWLTRASAADVVARWHDAFMARPDDELRALQLHMLHHGLPAEDFRGRLLQVAHAPALPAPVGIARTVVADCDDDALISPVVRQRVAARYPQARHVSLPAGGHYPHVVRIADTVAAMRAWLA